MRFQLFFKKMTLVSILKSEKLLQFLLKFPILFLFHFIFYCINWFFVVSLVLYIEMQLRNLNSLFSHMLHAIRIPFVDPPGLNEFFNIFQNCSRFFFGRFRITLDVGQCWERKLSHREKFNLGFIKIMSKSRSLSTAVNRLPFF